MQMVLFRLLGASLLLLHVGLAAPLSSPILFIDNTTVQSMSPKLSRRVNQPHKGPRVIKADKPWESWAVFAYNHVIEVPEPTAERPERYR